MKRVAILVSFLLAAALAPCRHAAAVGTPAGTSIVNRTTVTYRIDSSSFIVTSNIATNRVAEVLDVNVQWQDAAPVAVNPGDTARVTTFQVTNTGNGIDRYSLESINRLDGDDFDPAFRRIVLDADGDGRYDPNLDMPYVSGVNDPVLGADQSVIVFVLNDIPDSVLDGQLGTIRFSAASTSATGAPGAVLPGQGDFGLDAVIGSSGGNDGDDAVYVVSSVVISLAKSVSISDPSGGNLPVTGATLSYTIRVTASGSGTARSVVVTDSIPGNTTYVAGTLRLNAVALTDVADGDAGDVGQTTPGAVTVRFGDITMPFTEQTITFDVTIY